MRKTKFIFTLMLGCSLATMAKAATSFQNCDTAGLGDCIPIGVSGTYYALSGPEGNKTMTIYGTTGEGSTASVPEYAFFDMSGLTSTLPSGVTSLKTSGSVNIGDGAFAGATGLTSVDLTGVQRIGESAFEGAEGLTSVDLTGVQSIGGWAFLGATGLTGHLDLTGVETIGFAAFEGATGLTSVIISDSLLDTEGNILGYSCDVNNVCAGIDSSAFDSGLNTIYCPEGKTCGNNFDISGDDIISYSKENGKYVLADGTVIGTYQVATPSGPQPSQPSQPTKPQRADIRIYTIDEANLVAKPTGNTVRIKYR
ncbi:MAG: leucine-rich repeat domain-containing protein [Alphaproteobacteria bacterium]|nr:leucine-rich repeat domain-containing protein [Alphaproteobacteria bacterium]